MSVKVSSWVWHDKATAEVNGNELVVLLALADIANDKGVCTYLDTPEDGTQARLAKKARVHRATWIRCIDRLVERGILEVQQGRQHRPNGYRIMLDQKSHSATPVDSQMSHPVAQMSQKTRSDVANRDVTPSIDVFNVRDVSSSHAVGVDDEAKYSIELRELCDRIAAMVTANGHQVGVVGKLWWSSIERLVRLDGYTLEQIEIVARWATSDEFWAANIRSASKLRKQFSTLRAQRNRELSRKKPTAMQRTQDILAMGAELQAESERLAVSS